MRKYAAVGQQYARSDRRESVSGELLDSIHSQTAPMQEWMGFGSRCTQRVMERTTAINAGVEREEDSGVFVRFSDTPSARAYAAAEVERCCPSCRLNRNAYLGRR